MTKKEFEEIKARLRLMGPEEKAKEKAKLRARLERDIEVDIKKKEDAELTDKEGRGLQNHQEVSEGDVLNQIGVTAISGLPGAMVPAATNHLLSKPNFNREIPGYQRNPWGGKTGIPGKKGGLPWWASLGVGIAGGVASTGLLGEDARRNLSPEVMDAYAGGDPEGKWGGYNALAGDRSTDNIGLLGVDIPLIGKPIDSLVPFPTAIANGLADWNDKRHGRTHLNEETGMMTTPPPQRNSEGERVWMPAPRDINGNREEQMIYDPNTHQISPSGELVEKPKDGYLERGLREIRRVGPENMAD